MELQIIQNKIYEIRGQQVMLDSDLAELYQVETKYLKRTVNRNIQRFPIDFMFELNKEEYYFLRCQNCTLEGKGKYAKYLPYAFTEHGVTMLASVLRSDKAIDINIQIVRAFTALRQYVSESSQTAKELAELKLQIHFLQEDIESLSKDHEGYEQHFDDIYLALAELANRNKKDDKPRKKIGYI